MTKIYLTKKSIFDLPVEAIVNSANKSLLAGSGISGAIHKLAGKQLELECLGLGPCEPGQAVYTKGYGLKAKYVIHTVPPKYHVSTNGADEALISCYQNSLAILDRLRIRSVAFPCIGTGRYGFPKSLAAQLAIRVIGEHKDSNVTVFICCFDEVDYVEYLRIGDFEKF